MKQIIAQAGAITFRKKQNALKILLIRSKKDPERWVFPKGHIEPDETAEAASLRELWEEAGVDGEIVDKAGDLQFELGGKNYKVDYYICRFLGKSGKGEPGRNPQWFSVEDAFEKLFFPSSRELLRTSIEKLNCESIKQ